MIRESKKQKAKSKENAFSFFSKKPTSYNLHPTSRKSSGFTLIELLIVIAILAGLGSIVIMNFPGIQKRGRDTQRKSDIKQYQTAMELYANRNNGAYPNGPNNGSITSNVCPSILQLTICPEDPMIGSGHDQYRITSTLTGYILWATLELPPTPTTYFAVCSSGESGETTNNPSGYSPPNCPI